eukprot:1494355-Prymnesium_polylepis.1
MQRSHLDLITVLFENLHFAGAPERALNLLTSLKVEKEQTTADWFNIANNYASATSEALKCQKDVLNALEAPSVWEVDATSGCFNKTVPIEDRWQRTYEMRQVALVAARVGEHDTLCPAIKMLCMSLDPEHLAEDESSRSSSESRKTAESAKYGGRDSPGPKRRDGADVSLRYAITHKMDDAIRRALEDAKLPETKEHIKTLRVAYFVLHEGVVQPWPALLVHLLLVNEKVQDAFVALLKTSFDLIENPFTVGAEVLYFHEEKWNEGKIHKVVEMDGHRKVEVLDVRHSRLIKDLKDKHVRSYTTHGIGAFLLEAAKNGSSKLVKLLLEANVS